jgi:hypothetical protein
MLAGALSKALDDPAIQKRYVELGSLAPKSRFNGHSEQLVALPRATRLPAL